MNLYRLKWLRRAGFLALAFLIVWPPGLSAAEDTGTTVRAEDELMLSALDGEQLNAMHGSGEISVQVDLNSCPSDFAGGCGTTDNPYQIKTPEQLLEIANYPTSHFILIEDVEFDDDFWNRHSWPLITSFSGTFNGNNKTIKNLKINTSRQYVGMFGEIAPSGKVTDLILANVVVEAESDGSPTVYVAALAGVNKGEIHHVSVTGDSARIHSTSTNATTDFGYVGGLVGYNDGGKIHQSKVLAEVKGSGDYGANVGGLVGGSIGGTITDSDATGNVTVNWNDLKDSGTVGGLVGYSDSSSITDSHATGIVHVNVESNGLDQYIEVGGLVGFSGGSEITRSYAAGDVTVVGDVYDHSSIGGLVGFSLDDNINYSFAAGNVTSEKGDASLYVYIGGLVGAKQESSITNTYATGDVQGDNFIGGLVGYNIGGTITDAYATGQVIGTVYIGGLVGYNDGGEITNTYATGDVQGEDYVGGLVAWSQDGNYVSTGAPITNSYATGDVKGTNDVGGLVGYNAGYTATITNTYAAGIVTGKGTSNTVGGLVGSNYNGTVSNSYWKEGPYLPCGHNVNGSCTDTTVVTDAYAYTKYGYPGLQFGQDWVIDEGESTPYLKQVTLKNVTMPTINVVAGTMFEKLPFPEGVVQIGHPATTVSVDVYWEKIDYQPTKLGLQWLQVKPVLTGKLDGYTIVGPNVWTIRVNVKPLAAPTDVRAQPGDGETAITWKTVEGAESYTVYQKGKTGWDKVKSGIPNIPDPTDTITETIQGLANGVTYTFAVTAWNGDYESRLSEPIVVIPQATPSTPADSGRSKDDDCAGWQSPSATSYVLCVGKTTDPQTGKTTATVVLDEKRLANLARTQSGATVTIAVTDVADKYNIPLSGVLVQALATGQLVLEIQTPSGNYTLPLSAINLDQLAAQLGADSRPADVQFQVSIGYSDADTVALMEAAASQGRYAIVVPPVDFTITATYNGKTVVVSQFNTYIQREISIPADVDPNSVTTAVVLGEYGNVHHVPTIVVERNGRYYAVINSLTNSAYALIRNNKTFVDIRGHWAQGVVEDLASRLIVNGVDEQRFEPDQPITRAQFAALLIRALGLSENVKPKQAPFRDVPVNAWFAGAVAQAKQYGLLTGYQDGAFRPGRPINRFEAFVMLSRAMKLVGLQSEVPASTANATLSRFADGQDVAGWARSSVAATVQSGLVRGSGGKLLPNKTITRAEIAAILHRLLVQARFIQGK